MHQIRYIVILYNQKRVDANKENGKKKKNEASKKAQAWGINHLFRTIYHDTKHLTTLLMPRTVLFSDDAYLVGSTLGKKFISGFVSNKH